MEMENTERTELDHLGEFGLIDHITKNVVLSQPTTVKGIGDDAAVIDPAGKMMVVSTDMLVENIHFDLMYTPLKHLGYKSVIVNLSDIYAMNAKPTQITVSLALSNRFSVEAVEEVYSGILLAAKLYNVDVVGGDTTSSLSGLTISITAIGEAAKDDITYRAGASEGDLLVVSGDLGAAFMGLQLLEREKDVYKASPEIQPDLDGNDYILERQLKPEARKDVIEMLSKLGLTPTSMIDISDGLASEVLHICQKSEVGCSLYEEKIPIDPTTYQIAVDFNLDPTMCALNGGEDYELLFTIKQSDFDKVKGSPNFTVIGHMVGKNEGTNLITKAGGSHALTAQGWDAFLKKED
jgi:thiamine-monophosphate kinase